MLKVRDPDLGSGMVAIRFMGIGAVIVVAGIVASPIIGEFGGLATLVVGGAVAALGPKLWERTYSWRFRRAGGFK